MIFVVPHGRCQIHAVSQEKINRKGLGDDFDPKVIFFKKGPGLDLKFIAPKADLFPIQILEGFDAGGFFGHQHKGRFLHDLGDVDQFQTLGPFFDGRTKPEGPEVGLLPAEIIDRGAGRPTGYDGQVEAMFFIKPFFVSHIISGELGLGGPMGNERRPF